jgi:glucose/arabinose dehydrogenase
VRYLQLSCRAVFLLAITLLSGCGTQKSVALPEPQNLKAPPGFKVSVYADNMPKARQMVLSEAGTLFVGTNIDVVYALPDRNRDGKADEVIKILSGLHTPNGVAVRDSALFVAETSKITRYDNIEKQLQQLKTNGKAIKGSLVTDKLPKEEWHGMRYIRFGPDGFLYFGIGAPCNVCVRPDDERFGSIVRMKPDGSNFEVYEKGIRNTVGFDWHPKTKELWFTDNGRDYLGDNLPPDELNCAPKGGMHFGFPYRYGNNASDPEFGIKAPKNLTFTPVAMPLGPHVASLGMRFYNGNVFPKKYRDTIFIAEHGSWNRDKKIGYRISNVSFENGKPTKYETFLNGFLVGEEPWGRPVDLCIMPDGAMLVSDDRGGAVYRITYESSGKDGSSVQSATQSGTTVSKQTMDPTAKQTTNQTTKQKTK